MSYSPRYQDIDVSNPPIQYQNLAGTLTEQQMMQPMSQEPQQFYPVPNQQISPRPPINIQQQQHYPGPINQTQYPLSTISQNRQQNSTTINRNRSNSPSFEKSNNHDNEYNKDASIMRERRLRDEIKGLEDKVLSQLTLIDSLTLENTKLKTHSSRVEANQEQYKETLKKMYIKHVEQDKVIEQLKANAQQYVQNYDKVNVENVDLNNDIKNILVDREILEQRLLEGDKKYNYDIQSMSAQLSDKNIEISDLKRKLNDTLEIKRRLEEETASLRYALDNARAKMEAEVREKQIKLEQLERGFQENVDVKNQEMAGSQERIRELELEIRRLMDQNKNYAHELTILSKDLRFKDYETQKLNQTVLSGGAPPQQTMGYSPINQDLQNQQQYMPQQQMQTQHMQSQSQDMGTLNLSGTQQIQQFPPQQGMQQPIQQMQPQQRNKLPSQFQMKEFDRVDQILSIYEKNTDKKLKFYLLQLWKAKAELKSRSRQNKALVNLKYGQEMGSTGNQHIEEEYQGNMAQHEHETEKHQRNKSQDQQVVARVGQVKNIDWTEHLCNGIITVLNFTRTAISNVAFEVFGKSIQQANDKKLNALNVFMANMKEIKDKYWKGLLLVLETYLKTRKLLKDFLPRIQNKPVFVTLEQKLVLATGKIQKNSDDTRDNLNRYVETTIAHTIQKKLIDKLDKNRDFIYVFRLLTVKHRIRYPMRGKAFDVDLDLEVALDHKIVSGLQKLIVQD